MDPMLHDLLLALVSSQVKPFWDWMRNRQKVTIAQHVPDKKETATAIAAAVKDQQFFADATRKASAEEVSK